MNRTSDPTHGQSSRREFLAAPLSSKNAPPRDLMSNRYLGVGQYVRPIDLSCHVWPNPRSKLICSLGDADEANDDPFPTFRGADSWGELLGAGAPASPHRRVGSHRLIQRAICGRIRPLPSPGLKRMRRAESVRSYRAAGGGESEVHLTCWRGKEKRGRLLFLYVRHSCSHMPFFRDAREIKQPT